MVQIVSDPVEEWFESFRTRDPVPQSRPSRQYGRRRRLAAGIRDALPRPIYEAAVGRGATAARSLARKNPGRGRLLPHFIIIGTATSGTTNLYHPLSAH